METSVREKYLTAEITTAPPQKLQLMLIEAAIRSGNQALALWQEEKDEEAGEALVRCQQIVTELLCGLRPDRGVDLVRRVAAVYVYIFRTLSDAHLSRDEAKLADALSVLEVERETWQQVCRQLGSAPIAPHAPQAPHSSQATPTEGTSFEA